MENKRTEKPWEELDRNELGNVNGGILPGVPSEPDDDDQDSNGGGGATGGW